MGGPRPGLDPGTTGMPGTPMTATAAANGRTTFVCSCEDTMPLDGRAIARGCATAPRQAEQLCLAQLDRFRAALAEDRPITVACTAQAPLFQQEAEAAGFTRDLGFVNIRETAGWSEDAKAAGPKMAALIAAAAVPMPATALVPMKSEGVTLVLGRDEAALAIAARLAESLDVTVLLTGAQKVAPLRAADFPVARGRARAATGWLGAFEVTVDGYAMPRPSSRTAYEWGPARDGAASRCDVLVDLTGGAALFPTHEVRQGYLRADPADAAAVERLVARAKDLVGEFDKPRFVTFDASLCAHSRNRRTACTRCLDLCPTGAITPGKDSVLISAEICAGCGACAAVCPTGAAQYAMPSSDALLRRVRTLLLTYREAGGEAPALLVHDAEHGEPLIDALSRHGDGLPARVLPLRVNEVSQLDLSFFLAAFAWGAAQIRVLMKGRRAHGVEGVFRNIDYATTILAGLGVTDHGAPRAAAIETDDPFTMGEALRALPRRGLPFPRQLRRHRPAPRNSPPGRPRAGGRRRTPRGRHPHAGAGPLRHRAGGYQRLHPLRRLHHRLPDRRPLREPREAAAPLPGRCLRAVRPLRHHLPGEGHHAGTAPQPLPRQRPGRGGEGGRALLLRTLRQALRREKPDRPRLRQADRQRPLDVQGREAAGAAPPLRGLPRLRRDGRPDGPLCGTGTADDQDDRGLVAGSGTGEAAIGGAR